MNVYDDVRDQLDELLADARAEVERAVSRADALSTMLDLAVSVDQTGAPIRDIDDVERQLDEVGRARWKFAMRTVAETDPDLEDQPSTQTGDTT